MKVKFVDNVLYMIKKRGLKIGDVERSVGLRVGNLSRIKKHPNTFLDLNTAINIANVLGCTVDELCSNDIKRKAILAQIEELNKELEVMDK